MSLLQNGKRARKETDICHGILLNEIKMLFYEVTALRPLTTAVQYTHRVMNWMGWCGEQLHWVEPILYDMVTWSSVLCFFFEFNEGLLCCDLICIRCNA